MRIATPLALVFVLVLSWTLVSSLRETSKITASLRPYTAHALNEMQRLTITDAEGVETVLYRSPDMSVEEFLTAVGQTTPKKATWVSGGQTFMVITPKKVNETVGEWCDRHDELVEAAQEQHPPD